MHDNLYWNAEWQGLCRWGCSWREHRVYDKLEAFQKELGLEQASRFAKPTFLNPSSGDYRLPSGHPAWKLGCYPRGDVPSVRLGKAPNR